RAYAAPGNYRNGQFISVSVEFNEAVFSAPAELVTNFGTLHTEGIYRNNVVVYSGQINGTVGSTLSITGFNYGSTGSVQDMFGSSSTPAFPSNSFSNVRIVTRETPQQSGGSYNITNINELMSFIDIANQNPNANGVLMNDIDINPDGRYNIMLPQIGTNSGGYMGTFMGQGQMSLTNLSLGDELFKTIGTSGTVKNITFSYVYRALDFGTNGMLCNENNGTIEHCEITGSANDRAINVSQNYTGLGLLVGTNNGTISDCRVSGNYSFNKGGNVGHLTNIGGIVAENYGNIVGCLFVGDFSLPASYTGFIGTVCVYNRSGGNVTNSFGKYTSENDYNAVYSNSGGTITNSDKVSTDQLASGEVTWNLNGGITDNSQSWYQYINFGLLSDPYPVYSNGTVYKHGNIYTNSNKHILSHVDGIQEDCVNSGRAEYWYCTIDGCGKIFSDSAGHNETTLSDLEIPALGHDWSTEWNQNHEGHRHVCTRCGAIKDEAPHACSVPQYTWSTDNLTVDAYRYCDVCNGLMDSETVNTTAAPDTATCTETGYIRYTADFTKDGFSTQIKDIATPALGHDVSTDWSYDNTNHWHSCSRCTERFNEEQHSFGQPVWTWSKYFNASAKLTCSVCGEEITYDAVVTRSYSEMTSLGEQTLTVTATVTACGNTYTDEKSYPMLRMDVNSLNLTEGQYHDYYFIPTEDADYRIYSVGFYSVSVRIFDEDDNEIGYNQFCGSYYNFDILREMEAGKMYRVQIYSSNLTGYLGVHVKKPVTYPITYDNTVQHGNIRVEDTSGYEITRAYEGMMLYVDLTGDSGYRPVSATITDANGDTVSTHASFSMPASGVTVSATFTNAPIQLGENTVYIKYATYTDYSFTPSQDGDYRFHSSGDFDTSIQVRDGNTQIGYSSSSGGKNFDLTVSLEAGKTYTLKFWTLYRYNIGFDTDLITMYVERIYSQYDINEDGTEGIDDIAFIISASQGDISMTPAQTAKADIDGDGAVDGFDAAELDRILFGYTNPKGDVNQDGIVNSLDYAMLKSYVLCDNVDLLNKNYLDSEYDSIKDNYGDRVIITQNYYSADFNNDKSVDAFDVYYLDSRIYTIV
nr:dockerin type I repeat-containing protein [Clostridiales bacterium]